MTEFFFCLFTQGFVIDVAEIAKFSFAQVFSLRGSEMSITINQQPLLIEYRNPDSENCPISF